MVLDTNSEIVCKMGGFEAFNRGGLELLTSLATISLNSPFSSRIALNTEKRYQAERLEHEYRNNQRRNNHNPENLKVMEHWVPPENTVKIKSSPVNAQKMKIPKVREPKDSSSSSKKSSESKPPPGMKRLFWTVSRTIGKVSTMLGAASNRVRSAHNRFRANRVVPIHTKVQTRHLELEPLCCLSSCLVRGGCTTVVVFELCYVVVTFLCILGGMMRGGFTFWEPIPKTFNELFGHDLFYYPILIYDLAVVIMAIATARGLLNFDKAILRAHYYFCFVSLAVNVVFLIFSAWALASPGPCKFTPLNVLLMFCFFAQIPLQIWAMSVVKSCRDFFALIHVFVALAEA
ncbi:unnamed protein product [Caenorhabditis auriculariae]|uniref:Uncharacterized protein n=1 Tax=Caenorhabditis auriculariae TaxID=2777116 RepID=A0A8S1GRU0_9PELO|nr:unnamed protein product [Caenorhabditis auriculariae]